MKKIYLLLILLFVCLSGFKLSNEKNNPEKSYFGKIEKSFSNPVSEFRSSPLLVFNEVITKPELDRMINDLHEAGFGGFFVHPRPGLVTEYLSEEWFDLFKYATDKASQLGMEAWIYDENSYPSGFAGGHVPAQMPASFNQGQGFKLTKYTLLPDSLPADYLCLMNSNGKYIDITSQTTDYLGKEGDYYLYAKTFYRSTPWYAGYSYVDLLLPGVTEKFIDVTMEGYNRVLGSEYNKTVRGIFTDEPNIVTSGGFRWTPDLFEVFKAKWGYDLKEYLPLLSEETGDWKKVRYHYMETLLQLFIDRWAKPWFEYTKGKKLIWTGHYWEHGWPNMNDGPDNMAMYAWHQMPGIDMLFNQFNEESPQAQFGNVRSVKEVRSVANQMGYKRTLSETYGGGGWDVTFKDLKRLGDWEYVLGVNFMNQHLSHQTLTGARKYDYPPVFTYHSPWWNNYKYLNDYFARLSYVLSEGVQKNNIVVIEPNSTLWSYYSHSGSNPKLTEIGKNFQSFVTKLEKSQVEFDLASENIIKDNGKAQNGKFLIGKADYTTVIIPPLTENLSKPTVELLNLFVASGGKLICFSNPNRVDGVENDELPDLLNQKRVQHMTDLSPEIINSLLSEQGFKITHAGGNLYHYRKNYSDGEMLFIVNSSMNETSAGKISLKGASLIELDALEGNMYTYPSEKGEKGSLTFEFKLEPSGSLLLFSSKKTNHKYPLRKSGQQTNMVKADTETVVSRLKDNVLMVDFCDLLIDNKSETNLHISKATDIVFRTNGFENGNPWNSSVQYKKNTVERDTFSGGGFEVTYRFKVTGNLDKDIKLVVERPNLFSVSVNGKKASAIPGEWWLDKSFGVYSVGEFLKTGENSVELNIPTMSIFAEIEPVYLLGDFSVVPEKVGWRIDAARRTLTLGSWKEQNQPFYSWDVKYSKTYSIDDTTRKYTIKLGKWNGTVCEVYVNSKKAGIIGFDPYTLDVTSYLKKGKNQIDVWVIGSLKNLWGPHYNKPDQGKSGPFNWRNINAPISPSAYKMIDYGLSEDFELVY
ncbi:MAG: hypothetical protein LLF80_04115 [Porphyromonadaceae bacterium]|nr:hypothetical protein [Porphyromonadaceae bacterium]